MIADANAQVAKLTNGAVTKGFEDRGVRALGRKAAQTIGNVEKVDVIKGTRTLRTQTVTKLVIRAVDNGPKIKDLTKAANQTLKAVDKEIAQIDKRVAKERGRWFRVPQGCAGT
jgi:hypothetical protein